MESQYAATQHTHLHSLIDYMVLEYQWQSGIK
jgi:hypothetical protein